MSLKFDSTSNQNFWISNEHDKKRMLQYQLMEELNKVSHKTCKSYESNDLIECEKMKNQSASSSLEVNLTKRGSLQLWQFLLHLLTKTGHETIIEWSKKSSAEFKLLDPEEVARLWGIQKNRPTMNYDKLSRSLRYYYEKGIMQKVSGERYVYKFINHQDIYQLNPDLNELHNLKNQNEKQNGHKIKFNQVQKLVVNQTNSALKSTSSKLKTISSNKNATTLKQRYQPYSRSCSINQQNPISINNLNYEINNTNNYIIQNPTLLGYEQYDNSMVYQNQNFYSSYPYQSLNKNNIKQEYSTQNCDPTNSPSLLSSKFSANSSGFSSFANNSLNSTSYQSMSTNLESPKQTTNQNSLTSTPNCYSYYKSQQNAHYNYNQQLNNYDDCINSYNQSIMSPAYYSNTNRSNSNEKFTNYFQSNQMSSPIVSNGYFNEIEYDKSFKQSFDYNNSSYLGYDNNYNYNSNSTNLITNDCYSSSYLDSSNVNKLTSPLSISPSSVSSNSCVSSTSNSNSNRYSYNNENEQSPANYF